MPDVRRHRHVSPCPLLDDAFDERDREGHTRGLERLEVDRGEQPGPGTVRGRGTGIGEDLPEVANPWPVEPGHRCGRVRQLTDVPDGREQVTDVDDLAAAHCHRRRTVDGRVPDPADEDTVVGIVRQRLGGGTEPVRLSGQPSGFRDRHEPVSRSQVGRSTRGRTSTSPAPVRTSRSLVISGCQGTSVAMISRYRKVDGVVPSGSVAVSPLLRVGVTGINLQRS